MLEHTTLLIAAERQRALQAEARQRTGRQPRADLSQERW